MLRNPRVRGIAALLSIATVILAFVPSTAAVQAITGVSTTPVGVGVELAATVDVNPVNNADIAMSGNFGGLEPCSPLCTTYYPDWFSKNSGVSWSEGAVPGSQWSSFYIDPAAIFDSAGNYYIGNIINVTGRFGMTLFKSSDGGATFSRLPWTWLQSSGYLLSNGTYAHPCSAADLPSGLPFPYDFPRIFADRSAGSVYRGSLYYASKLWLETRPGSCTPGWLGFESSSDGGMTWKNLQAFDLTFQNTFGATWPISVSYNGTVYMTGEFGSECGAGSGVSLFKSTDGGRSFSVRCVYTPSPPYGPNSPIPAGDGVAIASSPVAGNFLDLVFAACPGSTYRSCISTKSPLFFNDTHVYSISSYDAGLTWSGPLRIDDKLQYDYVQDPSGRLSVGIAPNNRVDAAWFDFRNSDGNNTLGDIYFSYSNDLGNSFSQNARLTSQTTFICTAGWNYPPAVCTAGNEFIGLYSLTNVAYVAFDKFTAPNPYNSAPYQYFSQVSFASSSVGGALLAANRLALTLPYLIAAGAGAMATMVSVYVSRRRRPEKESTLGGQPSAPREL